ncbi:MAG TPA: FHA domain-containing protein [Anaerolineales bacterium]|nr:FHA domain-containing protein [Anaerolineales bacterium]
MITCQRCKASLFLGTLFCPECGLMVDEDAASPTVSLPVDEVEEITTKPRQTQGPAMLTRQDSIAVRVMGSTVAIPLRGQQDYILGRAEATQAILPDIDLNRYGAHEKGVSRLHCHLRYEGDSLMVVDLGSANGTFLNGTRLTPERPMPLSENDTISLGSLKVQVFRKV